MVSTTSRNLSSLLPLDQNFLSAQSMNFNSLPNKKMIVIQKFMLGRVQNIVEKGENAGYQHFLLFPQCFQKPSFPEVLKVGIEW